MLTYSQYLSEEKKKQPTQVSPLELKAQLGPARTKQLLNHPYFRKHVNKSLERVYRVNTDKKGNHTVDVLPYSRKKDTDIVSKKVVPKKVVQFQFNKNKVTNAHHFSKDDVTRRWKYKDSFKDLGLKKKS